MKKKRKEVLTLKKTENFERTRQKTQKIFLFLRGKKKENKAI
jgi:hypothetical protein